MKRPGIPLWCVSAVLLWTVALAAAQVVTYTNEIEYLQALARGGYSTLQEGFEEDRLWGGARTPNAAVSVTSQGITWTSNHPTARITTGGGPARSDLWGMFSSPHGDPAAVNLNDVLADGFKGSYAAGTGRLYGLGGWFVGTPGGDIVVILDGNDANPLSLGPLTNTHQFFGVIVTTGFTTFEIQEIEGTREDQKFVFADDFTFGTSGAPLPIPDISGCSRQGGLLLKNRTVTLAQSKEPLQTTTTNRNGCYRFATAVSGKRFLVRIYGPRSASSNVSGCVRLVGAPLTNTPVFLSQSNELPKNTTTNGNGCYAFTAVVLGKNFQIRLRGPVVP